MRGISRTAAICLLTLGVSAAVPSPPLAVFSINQESIAQMSKQRPLASVEVQDPVYRHNQRYQGLWLRDVLKELSRGRSESD